MNAGRRAWLIGAAAALGGVAIAPGVRLIEVGRAATGQPVSSKVRWGLLVDANRCRADCNECVLACQRENSREDGRRPTDAQWIR
ncbi:MAG: 4Fe-4S ferredoxin, partial [Burkholderiaceae bacterium]|nr:4Fe-4S ferredoxin [Burkholderiaceae bacterium]